MNDVVKRALVATIIAMGLMAPALAATPPPAPAAGGGQGLEIAPPVVELNADPGQVVTTNIRLRNVTSGNLVVTSKADDFGAKGEDGEPQILLDEKEATRYSLKYWVPTVPGFTLAPQEVKTASIKIVVPANAEPGGHYGVIRFTGVPPELQGTGVSLSASLGALVLMRVSGNITEQLQVADFYASHAGHKGSFFETGPINFTERLKNTGSVHVKPVGNLEVYDTFGKKISEQPINNPPRNVLPDSVRRFQQTVNEGGWFGHYTAKFSVSYGTGKTLASQTVGFWVIPWKLVLLILFLIVFVGLGLRHAVRRYNRYIIGQASKRR